MMSVLCGTASVVGLVYYHVRSSVYVSFNKTVLSPILHLSFFFTWCSKFNERI